jgi:SAM-dependent methyltransferase
MDIHESSPGGDKVSQRLKNEAKSYVASQFDRSIPFGSNHPNGYRSEDLQNQTFPDECFDIVVTQDVFEHIFEPDKAIKEIARALRPNGAFIATVPIILRREASCCVGRRTSRKLPSSRISRKSDLEGRRPCHI